MAFVPSQNHRFDGFDSSRQLALGLALGTMIGLIPQDNILSAGLLVVLILTGASFVTGIFAGVVVSFVSGYLNPLLHLFGEKLLESEWNAVVLSQFFELPCAAWTRLDNTVVAGSFVVGVFGFVPIYLASFYLFDKNRDFVRQRVFENPLTRWIVGYESVEDREE